MDWWSRSCDARVPNRSIDNTVLAIFPGKGRFAHRYPFCETPDTDFCSLPNSAERNFDPWEIPMPIGFGKRIAVR
jgi:hypothetical protein